MRREKTPEDAMGQILRQVTEAAFLAQVRGLADVLGYITYHTHDSRRSDPGFPDLVLVHPKTRRIIYAELKTVRGRLRPAQQTWIDALTTVGQEVYVWRPTDWNAIETTLKTPIRALPRTLIDSPDALRNDPVTSFEHKNCHSVGYNTERK